jgi:hypothetical protein
MADEVNIDIDQETMWTLTDDRVGVRLALPPLPVEGMQEPLQINLDFDAATVDAILERRVLLRGQMLPPRPVAKRLRMGGAILPNGFGRLPP